MPGCIHSPILSNTVPEVIASVMGRERDDKRHDDWEGKHKIIFIHRQHHCLHRISSGIFKIIAELSLFNKFSGYKLNILKSTVFFLDQQLILENKILIFNF